MLTKLKAIARWAIDEYRLPRRARVERRRDRRGDLPADSGPADAMKASMEWILEAQRCNATNDDGIARFYSLKSGWSASYAASTGHTIPVLLDYAEDKECEQAARRMLNWLLSSQHPDGSFPGGLANSTDTTPTSFSTASVLLGLAAGARILGDPYREATVKTADWLRDDQDADGCWRRHQSPYNAGGDNTFDTHIAWAMLCADREMSGRGYAECALRNVHWAISHQHDNGWLDRCCSSDANRPLSHTIGFALRGIVEAYLYSGDETLESAATRLADGLLSTLDFQLGLLPGRLDASWQPCVDWSCPTANAQIAASWLRLSSATGEARYADAAFAVNRKLRQLVARHRDKGISGGCKGSHPVDGGYAPYRYLTPRFCMESWALEQQAG